MIKAVLFDYGGVICYGGRPSMLYGRLAANLNIQMDEAAKVMDPAFNLYKRGQILEVEFWHLIENDYGDLIPDGQKDIWMHADELAPLPEIISFRDSLETKGIRTGVLSNVEPHTVPIIKALGGYNGYNNTTLSCQEGYAKPDKEIYEIALAKFAGILPEEILFIDDQQKFLEPAIELGMRTLLAIESTQIINDAQKIITEL